MTATSWLPARQCAVAVGAALVLAACGGGDATPPSTSAPAPSSSSASPSPSATLPLPTPSPAYGIPAGASPFSGLPGGADKPVLVVKIDNTRAAQPHSGLQAADLVYVEEVEWSLTRLAAVFSTTLPDEIGPIRSARISDIDIVAPFGRVAFSNSGAQTKLLPVLAAANIIDVSAGVAWDAFYNDPGRPAPVDHMADPVKLLAYAPDAAKATDIGLVFSAEPPPGGQPVESVSVTWPSSAISFTWDETAGNFVVGLNGEDSRSSEGGPQRAATAVIQSVVQTDSGYGDRYGGKTPLVETIGKGTALVLRDGRMWSVTWERPDLQSGTRFYLSDGTPMPFAIGQEWIVLMDRALKPKVR
ncbi:MAG: DUF3048 domain-containing protein [Actinomycetota bacterium]